ncbi:MAG: hypothetical protein HY302_13555 [Opitutae bacterium]|nr:hypothetical protein [Opitutae bacterium]
MKNPLLLLPLLSALASLSASVSYSPPAGGVTVTVPTGLTQHVSLPLLHAAVGPGAIRGRIDSLATGAINVPTAGWTAGAFSDPANPYYLRIISGTAAGRLFMVTTTANTATQLNVFNDNFDLAQQGIATGANGDVYELVLADTLLTLFGTTTLQGGVDAVSADVVQVWGGASWLVFYFNTTRSRWELNTDNAGTPSRNNFVLRPDRGIMIARRAATDLNFVVTGRVPETAPKLSHLRPGFSSLSLGVPAAVSLGTLALQTRALGWQSGTSGTAAVSADLVQVWGGASFLTFYFDSVNLHWQLLGETSQTNRDSFVVPVGRPVMIRRGAAAATPAESLVPMVLPYTIVTDGSVN